MNYIGILLLACCLAGCVTDQETSQTESPPKTWTSQKGLDDTASCLVKALNEAMKARSPVETNISHHIQIIEPHKIYEIAPQQIFVSSIKAYSVRISALQKSSAKISTSSLETWSSRVEPAISKCALADSN